jgi:hypothetical protein
MIGLPTFQHPALERIDIQQESAAESHQAMTDIPAVLEDEPA